MTKILFIPVGVIGGIVAGRVGRKAFDGVWGLLDEEQAPDPQHRGVPWKKLVPALLLEGAIFRVVRGVVDRGSRELFSKATGSWPGEERPDPA
jgi:hypothetical protein